MLSTSKIWDVRALICRAIRAAISGASRQVIGTYGYGNTTGVYDVEVYDSTNVRVSAHGYASKVVDDVSGGYETACGGGEDAPSYTVRLVPLGDAGP